jgi:hypothetical protein
VPNWCYNELHVGITADRDADAIMQQIKRRCAGTSKDGKEINFDFKRIVPPPDTPAYRDEPDQETARKDPTWWYNWNYANWGTKWNCTHHGKWEGNVIRFDTAWAPPYPIVMELSMMFEDVVFALRFDEPGCDFAGDYICINGEVVVKNDRHSVPDLDWLIECALDEHTSQENPE